MQADLLERFADTQSALIAALDAGDTAAMIAHTRDLGGITDALRNQGYCVRIPAPAASSTAC